MSNEDENWRWRAACAGKPFDLFFPGRNENPAAALAVCRTCPVRQACLDEHLDEYRGVFGGLTERQRASLRGRNNRPAGAPTSTPDCGTIGGYRRHRRRQEVACPPCLEAKRLQSIADRAPKKGAAA
jgi:hypothetical protein